MNCRQIESLLSDYLEGALKARDQDVVRAHLRDCPACRRRRDEVLTLEEKISEAIHWQPGPFPGFRRRALERWLAVREAPAAARRRSSPSLPPIPALRLSLLGAAMAIVAALLSLAGWQHQRPLPISPPQVVRREQPIHSLLPPPGAQQPTTPSPTRRAATPGPARESAPEWNAPHPRFQGTPKVRRWAPAFLTPLPTVDDLTAINADSEAHLGQWVILRSDEWEKIEARVHRYVRVRDDFVTIPFPRLASTSSRQIAEAVEGYKREAAVIDARLVREVTCAFKATALSDLCDHLRAETGIQLAAGPSVADEKVTLFCEKLPLREVMRQLSRAFGYTWLRSKKEGGEYRYELVQDLRSQLLEEELRNRDRDAALLALDREINRYRPYLDLSPDEALTRAKSAPPAEKKLLEKLARAGWGPLQMYFRLSPQDLAVLRAGQPLKFGADPRPQDSPNGVAQPLPPDVASGVLQSMREKRLIKQENGYSFANSRDAAFAGSLPPAAVPEARASVNLHLQQSELGQLTLDGGSGFAVAGTKMYTGNGDGPYAVGMSPAVLQPRNEEINARLANEADLRPRVTVQPRPSCPPTPAAGAATSPGVALPQPQELKVTSADVLEALHRATGLPIVADYYTHLYRAGLVSARNQPLFEMLNHLSDAMRLRWTKEPGAWLQFRSTGFYNDRLKEVPNRLLARWAAARREHEALPLAEFLEIAQLPDAQLDAADMAEGARECWGLTEWDMARGKFQRRHWRYLAQLAPAQAQEAMSAGGLAFTRMSLAQQQRFISLCDHRVQSLEELAGAILRVGYTQPGGFQWAVPEAAVALPGRGAIGLSPVRERTRVDALHAARRIDPQVDPAQIVPSELSLTIVYTLGDPNTRVNQTALQVTAEDVRMWGRAFSPGHASSQ